MQVMDLIFYVVLKYIKANLSFIVWEILYFKMKQFLGHLMKDIEDLTYPMMTHRVITCLKDQILTKLDFLLTLFSGEVLLLSIILLMVSSVLFHYTQLIWVMDYQLSLIHISEPTRPY